MPQPYNVVLHETQSRSGNDGYGWDIEVDREVIATSHGYAASSAVEAFHAAKNWAKTHEELGFPCSVRMSPIGIMLLQ